MHLQQPGPPLPGGRRWRGGPAQQWIPPHPSSASNSDFFIMLPGQAPIDDLLLPPAPGTLSRHCPQVHRRIVDSLLQLVEAERSGEAVNRYLLKHAVDMLSALRMYEDSVQSTLLASARQYYSREGVALINVGSTCWQLWAG